MDEARSWPRTVAIALPWLLAAGLAAMGVLGVGRPAGSPSAADEAPAAAGTGVESSPTPRAGETLAQGDAGAADGTPDGVPLADGSEPHSPAAVSGDAGNDLSGAVRMAVLAAARATLGSAGLTAADGATEDAWALDLRIDAIESVTDRIAVVTLTGLVIEYDGERWGGPHARTVAVPLRMTDAGPMVTGPAWPLPPPADASTEADPAPLDDADPALVDVLEHAGWAIDEVTAAGLVDGEVLRVEVTGVPPDRDGPSTAHVVWMLDAPGGPRLLPLQPPHQPSNHLQEKS